MSNDYIDKALATWYDKDHPLHLDPLHPAIKLAGEAGELLDLYGKHKYKPGFDWWNCRHCGIEHNGFCFPMSGNITNYTPLVLDELGDWWYYWRILAYQQGLQDDVDEWIRAVRSHEVVPDMTMHLANMNYYSAKLLMTYDIDQYISQDYLYIVFGWFRDLLKILDIDLDNLTELNYAKLNSDASQHGWKGATVK